MKRLCKAGTPDAGDILTCLQDHIKDEDMGVACKKQLQADEERSAQDFRLNFRLNKACFEDVQHLCMEACDAKQDGLAGGPTGQPCGGLVLRCLSAHAADVSSPECREEVFYFERREVEDAGLDVPLQRACKDDVETFCGGGGGYAGRDHSKVLSCLRTNRKRLSAKCREEELRFTAMEASDIRLTPTLMNACGLELHQFCKGVEPDQAFKCLQSNLQEPSMAVACRAEVELQTTRESEYFREDLSLSLQCDADVQRLCASEEARAAEEGDGVVIACLVQHFDSLGGTCQSEVSYLVRMSLWVYHPGNDLSRPCDADVASRCGNATSGTAVEPGVVVDGSHLVLGAVGQCLTDLPLAKILSDECKQLVGVVGLAGGHVGGMVDESRLDATLNQLAQLELAAREEQGDGDGGVELTGWMAFVAVLALSAVLMGGGWLAYKHFFHRGRDYTLVVNADELKSGDV
eukprot:TRINITY_DN5634_c2_g2_i3.p1 TRINITY_DN5634_c2_g2~~TRINITY_DN5634_c2_g2_i3.p1  ORF type:complete len:518 (-),score=31.75 TRINITY_DN5634_c2_g2_i3:238-1623(-)